MREQKFVDTSPTGEETIVSHLEVTEGFIFGDFSSVRNDFFLIERTAPTPSEKTIIETIPYSQGVFDFSMIEKDRFFNNRTITYKIENFNKTYESRKVIENDIKNTLMPLGIAPIYDTHDRNYHWLGKCQSVSVDDNAKDRTLTATIVFDCYPFAISNNYEGDDIWDTFNFENDVAQKVKYDVNGHQIINLINISSHTSEVEIIVNGLITINGNFGVLNLTTGTYNDTQLVLNVGSNELRLTGTGTIEFRWRKEVMI